MFVEFDADVLLDADIAKSIDNNESTIQYIDIILIGFIAISESIRDDNTERKRLKDLIEE